MDDEAYFIDREGNKISCDRISSHVGLARELLNQDEELQQEFSSRKGESPVTFLHKVKGYMIVSQMGKWYRKAIIYGDLKTAEQDKWLKYFQGKGYAIIDSAEQERKLEMGEK